MFGPVSAAQPQMCTTDTRFVRSTGPLDDGRRRAGEPRSTGFCFPLQCFIWILGTPFVLLIQRFSMLFARRTDEQIDQAKFIQIQLFFKDGLGWLGLPDGPSNCEMFSVSHTGEILYYHYKVHHTKTRTNMTTEWN